MDGIREKLFQHRMRLTKCRKAIIDALSKAEYPLTVDEIADRVGADEHNRSTYYRNVESLERVGIFRREDFGDGLRRYIINNDHRHFIRCKKCGRFDTVRDCFAEGIERRIEKNLGYRSIEHALRFDGVCPACR